MRTVTAIALSASLFALVAPASGQFALDVDLGGRAVPEVLTEVVHGPQDRRFFGTYCADRLEGLCKTVRVTLFGFPVGSREICADVRNAWVHVDHHLTTGLHIRGHLKGGGGVTIDGTDTGVSVAGRIVRTGLARVSGSLPGLDPVIGNAHLSANAKELVVYAQGEKVVLRKDACGNEPPTAELVQPQDGERFATGETVILQGEARDVEDRSFPLHRMRFHSHRQGFLDGAVRISSTGARLSTVDLEPGQHAISFIATDSGGLEDSRTVTITVDSRPHHEPQTETPPEPPAYPSGPSTDVAPSPAGVSSSVAPAREEDRP